MSTRKTTLFYAMLIAVSSLAVGMVIASRLDLTPASSAQTLAVPPMNSAPVTGALDAQTFRNVAKAQSPMVVNIRTETRSGRRTCRTSSAAAAAAGAGRPAAPVLRRPWRRRSRRPGGAAAAAEPRHRAPSRADHGGRRHRASSSARTASSSPTITSSKAPRKIEVVALRRGSTISLSRRS